MVVNTDPNYERKKQARERLNRSEEERKEEMLAELRKESVSLICLAYMYAKGFEETEIDITERLQTAEEQTAAFRKIYDEAFRDGRLSGISKGKRIAYEELIEDLDGYQGCRYVKDGCDYAVSVIKKHMLGGRISLITATTSNFEVTE